MNEQLERELTKHLIRLAVKWPFWATINFILEKRFADMGGAAAASTDGNNITYDIQSWQELSSDEREFLTLHEDAHVLLQHPATSRALHEMLREDYDHPLAQEAADYAVNNLLDCSGIVVPHWVKWHDPNYRDMSFEEIYMALRKERKGKKKRPGGKDPGPGGDGPPLNQTPDCGKDQDSNGKDRPRNLGNLEMGPQDEAAKKKMEQLIETAITNATIAAGSAPAAFERVLRNAKADRIDWRTLLAETLFASGVTEYTWRKPNRVLLQEDIIIPGTRDDQKADIVFMVDTSGSIMEEDLAKVGDYLQQLRSTFPALVIHVMSHDTEVYDDSLTLSGFGENPLNNITLRGGGGTQIGAAVAHVEENYPDARTVVWLTDGEIFDLHGQECTCHRCRTTRWNRYIFIVTMPPARVRGALPQGAKVCRLKPSVS